MSDRSFETELPEELYVTLRSIEFDNEYEGDDAAPHRTYFRFRLHIGQDAWQDYSVTVTLPYEDFSDLHQLAWTKLYSLLRNFAEVIRRKSDLCEITFKEDPS
ncbi:MAG TPA: hypothetical protein VKB08_05065 [Bradyrhizobium sp.]|nr:hypothetical protein [Bradyrhizobium sp.]